MKKGWKALSVLGFSIIMMAAFLMVGQADAKSKVPEVVEVKVGGVMTLSGPGAAWHGPGGKAEMVFFNHFNKQGGMEYKEPDGSKHRFKINHKYEDCAYNGKKAVTSYGRLRDWGADIITTHGSTPGAALIAACARDRLPVVHTWAVHPDPGYYRQNVDRMYLMPASVTDVDGTCGLMAMFKKFVWDKKHPGKPFKVGVIAFDNPPRRLYKKPYAKKLYAKAGIDLVGAAIVPITVTDATIEVKRLYDAGANFIVVDHTTSGTKVVLESAQRLGVKDKMDFLTWFNILRDLATMPEIFDGIYNPWSYPMYYSSERNDVMEKVGQIYLDADPEYWDLRVDWAVGVHHNMSFAMEAIKKTLEKYGREGMTRERIREVMFGATTVDTGIYPKFTVDPEFPYIAPYVWLYQLDAKKKRYNPVGMPVAFGPSVYQPRWSPYDDPKIVYTRYYEWP